MGCDLAVTFIDRDVSAEEIAQAATVSGSDATRAFFVIGRRNPLSANRPFFAIWSDEPIDLPALGMELSAKGRVCICWKSEHGGVAGYLIYERGREVANESDSGDDYLYVPSRGVEHAFGVSLGLTDDGRLGYPDMLLDDNVTSFEVTPSSGKVTAAPSDTVRKLLEEELEVEPVLPLDI